MIIAVDFDGTLHCGTYPAIGAPAPDAVKYMRKLHEDGHYIIINTCRCGGHLVDAINWLLAHDIPFSRINDNEPQNVAKYGNNSRKIYSHCYIDDKQVGGLPMWRDIYEWITEKENIYNNQKN